jgi:predicted ATPase
VGALVQLARVLWLQGFPDQAMKVGRECVDEAVAVGHTNSLCLALADGAGMVAILNGDRAAGAQFGAMLSEHAGKHALGVWRTYGRAMQGWLHLRGGGGEGIELLRSALADLKDTPLDLRLQLYLVWLADALLAEGQFTEGLAAIDQALNRAERTGERWDLPELLRIRGELLLRLDGPRAAADARQCFAHSLEVAREQAALGWELRTTMSLARAARATNARRDAHAVLEAVLARFTEGFATADLVAARALLAASQ